MRMELANELEEVLSSLHHERGRICAEDAGGGMIAVTREC